MAAPPEAGWLFGVAALADAQAKAAVAISADAAALRATR